MKETLIKAAVDLEKTKGEIVSKTLDTLNSTSERGKCKKGASEAMNASYEFNKSVLSAVYEAKGVVTNTKS